MDWFGKFHYMLLALCGMIYMDTAIGITLLSFVLPAAQCDFDMTSEDKGWLTAAPMLGMVVGSYFWGCLADTQGRKYVLVAALVLDAVCGIASSISQYFGLFMFFRFFNGFGLTGAMGICYPYLGEFQATKYREKILCWMEMFWTIGVIILPGLAWLLIPLQVRFESEEFIFDSWNLFVLICSLPSLLLALWLLFFPESPKFLFENGCPEEAIKILQHIYAVNTGDAPAGFPIETLKEKSRHNSSWSVNSQKSLRSIRSFGDLQNLLREIWEQTKSLCSAPHLRNTLLTCFIQFGLTSSYYTLMVWFPELFTRFEEFEVLYPGQTASVCEVSSVKFANITSEEELCSASIEETVYLNTLIIGLACIPTSIWLPLCVHRLGTKFFLVFSLVVAGGVTLGFYFVQNATENLILSCIFEALTSLGISTVYCVIVDLFPTNLRVTAAALSLTFGRGGALLGNLVFGFLIDLNCIVPVILFAALLIASGIACFFLPSTGKTELD
ncbi:synaptic vesicle glycoprotein 2B isoform X2 [Anabrus simplex]|uniref:synaptic vesicle glycoprotein 2B isoform X2 n=1 Tax=Anabrus simplex TaxID=316456 RepID=UPI0035A28246